MADLTGRYVGDRYRVLRRIGVGGMGDVYAAKDLKRKIVVALKVLRRDVEDPNARERFLREAEILGALSSDNIVKLHSFDRDLDLNILFLTMDYASGDDLSDVLKFGRLPAALALEVLDQVASALDDAHSGGVIHRDLKPANIKIRARSDGTLRVKVLDFGLARQVDSMAEITASRTAPGTLAYMPPEVLREEPLDYRGDLYALGVILYEMLSGRAPFIGSSRLAVARRALAGNPTPLGRRVPEELPPPLIALTQQLMHTQPDHRPQAASDVRLLVEVLRSERADLQPPRFDHRGGAEDPFEDWGLLVHAAAEPL